MADLNVIALRQALKRRREQLARAQPSGPGRRPYSLSDVSQRSGINRATIHAIESTRREPHLKPDLPTVAKLADTYGLTLGQLFASLDRQANSTVLQSPGGGDTRRTTPPGVPNGGDSPLPAARVQESLVIIAVQTLADAIERSADRAVTRLIEGRRRSQPDRQQTPAARKRGAVRARGD